MQFYISEFMSSAQQNLTRNFSHINLCLGHILHERINPF